VFRASPVKRPVRTLFWDSVFPHRLSLFPHLILKEPVFGPDFIHRPSLSKGESVFHPHLLKGEAGVATLIASTP